MNKRIQAQTRKIRELPTFDRPAYRIDTVGAASMSDAELLTLITNLPDLETAQALLSRTGGRLGLSRMAVHELRNLVGGVGRSRGAAIAAAIEFGKRIAMQPGYNRLQVTSPAVLGEMLRLDMGQLDREEMRIISLDTKQRVLSVDLVYRGSVNASLIRIGELFKSPVRWNATAAILAHNHPSGDPMFSPEDCAVTREAVQAGNLLDIHIIDHIIVGRDGWISLRQRAGTIWRTES